VGRKRLAQLRRTNSDGGFDAGPESERNHDLREYLKDELARQDARQSSFEQRGIAVVTTAGTLVTLLFGLAALYGVSKR
jgi:hypothetical protein